MNQWSKSAFGTGCERTGNGLRQSPRGSQTSHPHATAIVEHNGRRAIAPFVAEAGVSVVESVTPGLDEQQERGSRLLLRDATFFASGIPGGA